MNICELTKDIELDFIKVILEPFTFKEEDKKLILNNFQNEINEIGDNRVFFLGMVRDAPVTTVQLVLKNADNNPELANGKDIAHIHNLWTKKDVQRLGYAQAIMEHLEKSAKSRGIKILTLGVDDCNLEAISLYKKLGYKTFKEEEGRTPEEKLFLMKKHL